MVGCGKKEEIPTKAQETKSDVPDYMNATGLPIVKKPITLKAFALKSGNTIEFEKLLIWQEYEKMTGIHIEWEEATSNGVEKRNLKLASGDLPDIFFKGSMPVEDLVTYGSQGTFIKLNDLIEKYGPNMKKIFEKFEEIKKGLKMPDGNIYSLPYVDDSKDTQIQSKLFINRKWLNKVGMKAPETIDELYNVLKAFKEKDPNGNGKADEIPYSAPYGIESAKLFFAGSFGLLNVGLSNSDFDLDEKTDKLRFVATQPEYKELMQFMNKLYTEGLLDNEIFTATSTQFTAKGEKGVIGAFNGNTQSQVGQVNSADFDGVPVVLKGSQGHQNMSIASSALRTIGTFTITKANKYPEATMRWIDYFYGEEGTKLFCMGIEGKTYKMKDGNYEFVEDITKNPNGLSFDQALGRYLCTAGGNNPTVITEKYFKGATDNKAALELANKLAKYYPKKVLPPFVFTKEESQQMSGLKNDIQTYVREMQAQFISGKTAFSNWDSYVSQIKKMSVDEYLKINQAAYDRYKKP